MSLDQLQLSWGEGHPVANPHPLAPSQPVWLEVTHASTASARSESLWLKRCAGFSGKGIGMHVCM